MQKLMREDDPNYSLAELPQVDEFGGYAKVGLNKPFGPQVEPEQEDVVERFLITPLKR
jgi:hypothetical protein